MSSYIRNCFKISLGFSVFGGAQHTESFQQFQERPYTMAKKLFVGGLPWTTTNDDLKQLFSQYGNVTSATVITDKMSGRSRGFGFVEFENDADADAAIAGQDGKDFGGRTLMVKEARPMEDRPKRNFGDRGGSRGGYGGGNSGYGGGNGGSGGRGGYSNDRY